MLILPDSQSRAHFDYAIIYQAHIAIIEPGELCTLLGSLSVALEHEEQTDLAPKPPALRLQITAIALDVQNTATSKLNTRGELEYLMISGGRLENK